MACGTEKWVARQGGENLLERMRSPRDVAPFRRTNDQFGIYDARQAIAILARERHDSNLVPLLRDIAMDGQVPSDTREYSMRALRMLAENNRLVYLHDASPATRRMIIEAANAAVSEMNPSLASNLAHSRMGAPMEEGVLA